MALSWYDVAAAVSFCFLKGIKFLKGHGISSALPPTSIVQAPSKDYCTK